MKKIILFCCLLSAMLGSAHAFRVDSQSSCSGCKIILQENDIKAEAAQFMLEPAYLTERFAGLYDQTRKAIIKEVGEKEADELTIEDFAMQILAQ